MKNKTTNRLLSMALAVLMALTLLPISALASQAERDADAAALREIIAAQGALGVNTTGMDATGSAITWTSDQITAINWSGFVLEGKLDFSVFPKLANINIRNSQVTELNVTGLSELTTLDIRYNTELETVTLRDLSKLTSFFTTGATIQNLIIDNWNAGITSLNLYSNGLNTLSINNMLSLTSLDCSSNNLSSLTLSNLPALTTLDCSNNQLQALDISTLGNLKYLYCFNNKLQSLDVSRLSKLEYLRCENNNLTVLNTAGYTALQYVSAYFNQFNSSTMAALCALNLNTLTCTDESGNAYCVYQDAARTYKISITCVGNGYVNAAFSSPTATLTTYANSGYQFIGFEKAVNLTAPEQSGNSWTSTSQSNDMSITAVFNPTPKASVAPSGTSVAAGTDELTITFDQEMDTTASGSVTINKSASVSTNPVWTDNKTLVYDLGGLACNTEYTVIIRNFKNEAGLQMSVILHKFTTGWDVIFDTQGGSAVSTQSVASGASATNPGSPTRAGYTFEGWYTAPTGGSVFDFNTAITAVTTIYAQWKAESGSPGGGSSSGGGLYTPPPPSHGFEGSANTYIKGSGKDLVHITQKGFLYFSSVRMDGKTLTRSIDYKAESGSTVVTIFSDYLDTLSVGKHKLTVVFTDGVTVTAEFTIKEDEAPTPEAWVNPFEDVREGDWYYGDVEYVYTHNLMSGTSTDPMLFSPNIPLTRGMVVTILYRAEGNPDVSGLENPFSDVAAEMYYADAVKWAAANDIVTGYGDGRFVPEDNISREELVTVLYRYIQYKGGGFEGDWMFLLDYADRDDVADWAYEAVCWCTINGIITGKPGNLLDPKGTATRAEAAAMLHRMLGTDSGK